MLAWVSRIGWSEMQRLQFLTSWLQTEGQNWSETHYCFRGQSEDFLPSLHYSNFHEETFLKIFQECFLIFQNDLETKLILSVLNRYFNLWQRRCSKKEIRFNIIWFTILNKKKRKNKTKLRVTNSLRSFKRKKKFHVLYFVK